MSYELRKRYAPAVCCSDRFGIVAKPVLETCRAEARVIAWGEALIVHLDAEVKCLGIGDYRPCVPRSRSETAARGRPDGSAQGPASSTVPFNGSARATSAMTAISSPSEANGATK